MRVGFAGVGIREHRVHCAALVDYADRADITADHGSSKRDNRTTMQAEQAKLVQPSHHGLSSPRPLHQPPYGFWLQSHFRDGTQSNANAEILCRLEMLFTKR
jgi:hypothetical protein